MLLNDRIGLMIQEQPGEYCINNCTIRCCDFTGEGIYHMMLLSEQEVKLLFGDAVGIFKAKNNYQLIHTSTDHYILRNIICPKYDIGSRRCNIHESVRPDPCSSNPIMLSKDETGVNLGVELDGKCPYIQENWEKIIDELMTKNGDEILSLEKKIKLKIPSGTSIYRNKIFQKGKNMNHFLVL